MTNVSTSTLFAVAHSIGNAQSVPPNSKFEMVFKTSSNRCRGEIDSGEIPSILSARWNNLELASALDEANPTTDVFGSVATVTKAKAAEISLAVIGKPDTCMPIDPDTSS